MTNCLARPCHQRYSLCYRSIPNYQRCLSSNQLFRRQRSERLLQQQPSQWRNIRLDRSSSFAYRRGDRQRFSNHHRHLDDL